MRHVGILSQNQLHHSIPRGRFTLFRYQNSWSTDLRFWSVVWVSSQFGYFKLNFRHWNLKISALWRHREFLNTNSESVNKALSDSRVRHEHWCSLFWWPSTFSELMLVTDLWCWCVLWIVTNIKIFDFRFWKFSKYQRYVNIK